VKIFFEDIEKYRITTRALEQLNNGESVLIGEGAGFSDNSNPGKHNHYIGYHAGYKTVSTGGNTGVGHYALSENLSYYNTALRSSALKNNTTGGYNTAIGALSLSSNMTGSYSTSIGYEAMKNSTGSSNLALGYHSLYNNVANTRSTALGIKAMYNASNTAIGTDTYNTAVGYNASVNASNKIVLGNASATTVGGYGIWTNYSDMRLKENITYRDNLGLEFIMKLNTVSYNHIEDENKRRRDGLIAQDVQESLEELGLEFSGLVVDDDAMQTMNLSYGEFVVPLINAIKEQQIMIEELQKEVERLKSEKQP
jgi:hypothetical protein